MTEEIYYSKLIYFITLLRVILITRGTIVDVDLFYMYSYSYTDELIKVEGNTINSKILVYSKDEELLIHINELGQVVYENLHWLSLFYYVLNLTNGIISSTNQNDLGPI